MESQNIHNALWIVKKRFGVHHCCGTCPKLEKIIKISDLTPFHKRFFLEFSFAVNPDFQNLHQILDPGGKFGLKMSEINNKRLKACHCFKNCLRLGILTYVIPETKMITAVKNFGYACRIMVVKTSKKLSNAQKGDQLNQHHP